MKNSLDRKDGTTAAVDRFVRRYGYFLLFLIASFRAQGQPMSFWELPFEFRDGLIWIRIAVEGRSEPLNFLLDTGASVSVVDVGTAKQLGLKLGRKVSVTGVHSRAKGYWPVKLPASTSDLPWPNDWLALDLTKLSGACSRHVDGLLGADFFRERIMEIDYAARTLRELIEFSEPAGGNTVDLDFRPCGMRVKVQVNGGKDEWVRLDTGCATPFQWVVSKKKAEGCVLRPAVGLSRMQIPQTTTGVRLGIHCFDAVPTGLHREPIFPGESGLLGNALLAELGLITIDGRSGRLRLGPTGAR